MKRKINSQTLARESLRSGGFLSVNKKLLQVVGPNLAIYISNLADKHEYFESIGRLQSDGSFFLTHENQIGQTGMTEKHLRQCKRECKRLKVITKTKMKGLPAKEFYLVDFEVAVRLAIQESTRLDVPDPAGLDPQEAAGLIKDTKDKDTKDKSIRENQNQQIDSAESIVLRWNRLCKTSGLPRCIKLTDPRRVGLNGLVPQKWQLKEVYKAIRSIHTSSFCRGESDSGWKPTIDFLYAPKTNAIAKALEGFYDGKTGSRSGQRIITRRGGEAVLRGGEPELDRKWFPLEDQEIDGKSVRIWENANGDKVICDTYPQPDPDGPMIGVPMTNS